MTEDEDEDGPGPYLLPGTQVRYDGLPEEFGPEYGVVVHCWFNDELGGYDCLVAFFGSHQPAGDPGAPYILRYPSKSLAVLGPDHVAQAPMPQSPSGEPLLSANLSGYVESEFGAGRGRGLRGVQWALERPPGPETRWRGDIINLRLDRTTNLVTVSLEIYDEDEEDDAIEPEVVDYEEFKRFVLRVRQ